MKLEEYEICEKIRCLVEQILILASERRHRFAKLKLLTSVNYRNLSAINCFPYIADHTSHIGPFKCESSGDVTARAYRAPRSALLDGCIASVFTQPRASFISSCVHQSALLLANSNSEHCNVLLRTTTVPLATTSLGAASKGHFQHKPRTHTSDTSPRRDPLMEALRLHRGVVVLGEPSTCLLRLQVHRPLVVAALITCTASTRPRSVGESSGFPSPSAFESAFACSRWRGRVQSPTRIISTSYMDGQESPFFLLLTCPIWALQHDEKYLAYDVSGTQQSSL
ncbi:hypothetical protein PR048_014251 [Dryococelus australis]|uniref:Uncharacterized protein n=1 Tax=Dryococelus australis TaxID=614101 RepID=A0ABQ9HEG0_9NEOP|nr:hypothetical protein PR048_014251 [Dryococelus australis]